jgi:hypothetical protein
MKRIPVLLFFAIAVVLFSCTEKSKDPETTKVDNISTTFSSSAEKLGKLIDLKKYKPTEVTYKHTVIDNSGEEDRVSVPGPSDYSLQVVLYFDSATFESMLDVTRKADYEMNNYSPEDFRFDFLPEVVMDELNKSSKYYHGNRDLFFGSGGKIWLLDKKVLLIHTSR